MPVLVWKLHARGERGRKGRECKFPKIAHRTFDTIHSWPPVHGPDTESKWGFNFFSINQILHFARSPRAVSAYVWVKSCLNCDVNSETPSIPFRSFWGHYSLVGQIWLLIWQLPKLFHVSSGPLLSPISKINQRRRRQQLLSIEPSSDFMTRNINFPRWVFLFRKGKNTGKNNYWLDHEMSACVIILCRSGSHPPGSLGDVNKSTAPCGWIQGSTMYLKQRWNKAMLFSFFS